jgi:hypothetical protein
MNPMTDPFAAKVVITAMCVFACAISFFMGRISTEMFADEETPETPTETQEKTEVC